MTIEILDAAPEQPMRPRDCACLVCIPTSRIEFFDDLALGRDFVESWIRQCGALTAKEGWETYEPYADLVNYTMKRVARRKVTTFNRANLSDFHRALGAFPVVTLVAHWRSARFRPTDICDDTAVRAFVSQASVLPKSDSEGDGAGLEQLCSALNSLLDDGLNGTGSDLPVSQGGRVEMQFVRHKRRRSIEAALPGAFRGGAAVEFADGFHTMDDIVEGIPSKYAGALDLTVCQSVQLGEMIQNKCRKCLVLKSADETHVDFRFALYHQVIEVLAGSPQPFEDAVFKVRKALITRYGKDKE